MVKLVTNTTAPAAATATPGDAAGPGNVENLEDLAREAAQLQQGEQAGQARTAESQQQASAQASAQAMNEAVREVAVALQEGRDMLADLAHEADILPREKTLAIWNDDRLVKLAGPLLVLAARHGGELGEFLKSYGPYMALLAAAAMPTIATAKAIRHHKALTVQAREVPAAPPPGGASGG